MGIYWRWRSLPELRELSAKDRRRVVAAASEKARAAGALRWLNVVWAGLAIGLTVGVMWFGGLHEAWIFGEPGFSAMWPVVGMLCGVVAGVALVWPWAIRRIRPYVREYLMTGS